MATPPPKNGPIDRYKTNGSGWRPATFSLSFDKDILVARSSPHLLDAGKQRLELALQVIDPRELEVHLLLLLLALLPQPKERDDVPLAQLALLPGLG